MGNYFIQFKWAYEEQGFCYNDIEGKYEYWSESYHNVDYVNKPNFFKEIKKECAKKELDGAELFEKITLNGQFITWKSIKKVELLGNRLPIINKRGNKVWSF